MATGKIPFREGPEKVLESEKAVKIGDEKPVGLVGQKETVDELVMALKKEKQIYERKISELAAREQTISNQQEIITMMKSELDKSRNLLGSKILEAGADEQANLKRLSMVYSKMDPESASTLLMDMISERAARIINLIPERQAAAILGAAVAGGEAGTKKANEWTDSIRRMKQEKAKKGT